MKARYLQDGPFSGNGRSARRQYRRREGPKVLNVTAMKERKVRQLAAVMFADIVGYSAIMQGDEQAASLLRARHREVVGQEHERYGGRIVMYYGDGVLSVFASAVEAVECAIAMQRQLGTGNAVPLRIGLHLGDIVWDDTEVYGDGVNVAARIESLGIAGAILLSGKVADEIRNHIHIPVRSLGLFELKNIKESMEVFAVAADGIVVPEGHSLAGKTARKSITIAVLPFVNMSASPENEFFSDGMTEEIINALARIENLRVTSRTSSFFFKQKNIPVRQIGAELNVTTLLEGSVRISGNMLRITAQLVEAEKDFHFWSQTWDRKLENIFDIQDEISLLIAEKLREHLGHFEIGDHLVRKQTDNYNAYEWFLKARFHFRKWNPEDVKTAITYYERALALDPAHAESILGMADCYGFLATTGFRVRDIPRAAVFGLTGTYAVGYAALLLMQAAA